MIITFLGTGTSQGVPVIGCPCEVCASIDPKDNRLRTSVFVSEGDKSLVIDTGPDFRQQMLREKINHLDAVLFTHEHKDHTGGLDDIRAFNFFQNKPMEVFATKEVKESLYKAYDYIFRENPYPGAPRVNMNIIDNNQFQAAGFEILPILAYHFKLPVFGFRIGDFTYLTDANSIPEKEKEKMKNSRVLVLNALRQQKHISHFSLEEAVDTAMELGAETTYLTHISHQMGIHNKVEELLPSNVFLAYDGLQIQL